MSRAVPGASARAGEGGISFPWTKERRFAAGRPNPFPPRSNARRSISSWKAIPARGSPAPAPPPAAPKSSGATAATIPLLAKPESRARPLMPFTTAWPSPDAAFITSPPGHMQKDQTPRPPGVRAARR